MEMHANGTLCRYDIDGTKNPDLISFLKDLVCTGDSMNTRCKSERVTDAHDCPDGDRGIDGSFNGRSPGPGTEEKPCKTA